MAGFWRDSQSRQYLFTFAGMEFSQAFRDIHLQSDLVLLRPMKIEDADLFLGISKPPSLWTWFTRDLSREDELRKWVAESISEYKEGQRYPFTFIEKSSGLVCGSSGFGNISFYDSRLEIGWTWLGREFMGTGINRHAKYLMLEFAFDRLGMERVEFKTDKLNTRARQALMGIGAVQEGILRSHMLMHGGRRRDSVYFSILKSEWPVLKATVFSEIIKIKS